jgi:hypothetical protein
VCATRRPVLESDRPGDFVVAVAVAVAVDADSDDDADADSLSSSLTRQCAADVDICLLEVHCTFDVADAVKDAPIIRASLLLE